MMIPSIHLNGTSQDELLRQATEAAQALRDAVAALSGMSPNGRDYYPQGPTALRTAEREHEGRIGRVRDVLQEIETYAEAVAGGR